MGKEKQKQQQQQKKKNVQYKVNQPVNPNLAAIADMHKIPTFTLCQLFNLF